MDLDVVAKLQGQVGTLSAAARPESQEPITVDREWLFLRSYTQKVNTPKMEVGMTFTMYKHTGPQLNS